ncbi:hypothetical protein NL676_033650 [Syzygium grande]|nr:hypothetical protein NL676_033650 [Syzygium grande]
MKESLVRDFTCARAPAKPSGTSLVVICETWEWFGGEGDLTRPRPGGPRSDGARAPRVGKIPSASGPSVRAPGPGRVAGIRDLNDLPLSHSVGVCCRAGDSMAPGRRRALITDISICERPRCSVEAPGRVPPCLLGIAEPPPWYDGRLFRVIMDGNFEGEEGN